MASTLLLLIGLEKSTDLTTRAANAEEVSEFSEWQNGSDFLEAEINEWPIYAEVDVPNIPEMKAVSNMMGANQIKERLADRFDLSRFSIWTRLKYTTTRILKLYDRLAESVPILVTST